VELRGVLELGMYDDLNEGECGACDCSGTIIPCSESECDY
jgi:hypothetical protein